MALALASPQLPFSSLAGIGNAAGRDGSTRAAEVRAAHAQAEEKTRCHTQLSDRLRQVNNKYGVLYCFISHGC